MPDPDPYTVLEQLVDPAGIADLRRRDAAARALVEHWRAAPDWRGGDYTARTTELCDDLAAAYTETEEKP